MTERELAETLDEVGKALGEHCTENGGARAARALDLFYRLAKELREPVGECAAFKYHPMDRTIALHPYADNPEKGYTYAQLTPEADRRFATRLLDVLNGIRFRPTAAEQVEELEKRVEHLAGEVATLQQSNSKLWNERNAAVEGGWSAIKKLHQDKCAREIEQLHRQLRQIVKDFSSTIRYEYHVKRSVGLDREVNLLANLAFTMGISLNEEAPTDNAVDRAFARIRNVVSEVEKT